MSRWGLVGGSGGLCVLLTLGETWAQPAAQFPPVEEAPAAPPQPAPAPPQPVQPSPNPTPAPPPAPTQAPPIPTSAPAWPPAPPPSAAPYPPPSPTYYAPYPGAPQPQPQAQQQWQTPPPAPMGVPPVAAPPLPPPPPTVCKDRQPSAYETDLDCGGVCEPCAIEQSCRGPNDCVSGLCSAGICKERLYEPGTPVPPGYRLEPSHSDRASTARWGGIGFFALSYGTAYVAALSSPSTLAWLYVPLVGPWPLLAKAEEFAPEGGVGMTKVLLVTDGALQVAGALLWLGGVIGREQQLLRTPAEEQAQVPAVWVSPTVGQSGYSVSLGGLF